MQISPDLKVEPDRWDNRAKMMKAFATQTFPEGKSTICPINPTPKPTLNSLTTAKDTHVLIATRRFYSSSGTEEDGRVLS